MAFTHALSWKNPVVHFVSFHFIHVFLCLFLCSFFWIRIGLQDTTCKVSGKLITGVWIHSWPDEDTSWELPLQRRWARRAFDCYWYSRTKVQEVLLGKDEKLKLAKAMDIARTREATVNDMKSLEQQGRSTCTRDNNIDAIKQNISPQCGKCGLSHGKKCPAQGTRCRKCNQWKHWKQLCRNKQTRGQKTKFEP